MITRYLNLKYFHTTVVQRSYLVKNFCSFYHGHNPFDEMPDRNVHRYMLNLIKQNQPYEALIIFMRQIQKGITKVDEFSIAVALKACIGHSNLGSQIHGLTVTSGYTSCASVCNSLMNVYCKAKHFRKAVDIFENTQYPDTVSYNTIMSGFEDSKSAIFFARDMHSDGIDFDAVTYTSLFAHCTSCMEFGFGLQIHSLALKSGFKTEIFIGNSLVTMYSKCGEIEEAERVFREIAHKDLVSWNAILSGYVQEGGYGSEAILAFIEMVRGGMNLDHVSFASVISACVQNRNLNFGKRLHAMSLKSGYGKHVSVCNILMSLYSKFEMNRDVKLLFENTINRSVVTWTTMISMDEEDAINLFREMRRQDVHPNDVTFIALIHAISKQNLMKEGLSVHAFCLKSSFHSEINVANCFITMYGKFNLVESSVRIFEEIEFKEIISWNALISTFSQNGRYQEALHSYFSASKDLLPTPHTLGSVLHAIATSESISLRQGQRCHCCTLKLGLNFNPVVSSALLDMYAKRGSMSESEMIFHELSERNQVAWTSMISAYSRHGDYKSVMSYFKNMVTEGVKPDSITFLSLLTSCGRNGNVDTGIEIFNSMVLDHLIEPSSEHLSCIVDMFGRAGRLVEAEEFLNRIPGGAGISVLQSLLSSCRIYGNVEMAMRIADALIDIEPEESGSYVLMSNLFAEKGKWEKVSKMRRMMRDKKVIKEIGFSWADVGHGADESLSMHGFSSGDKSHSLSKEIDSMAELLGSEMKRRRERYIDL